MARNVTIALVQMQPVTADPEANLSRMGEYIESIGGEQNVNLIVFPELSYTGAELGLRATDLAERVPGHAVNYLAKRAKDFNTHVVFGMVVKEKVESILYNSLVCIAPEGDIAGVYHKVHLLGEERQVYRNGFRFVTVEADWGRFGISSGDDLTFPETARALALEGAELMTVSANWDAQWHDSWRAHLISRACENAFFVAAANRIGEGTTAKYQGDSLIVGPRAEQYTVLDEPVEGYAIATIDLEQVRAVREERQLIQFRMPEAYRTVVKKY